MDEVHLGHIVEPFSKHSKDLSALLGLQCRACQTLLGSVLSVISYLCKKQETAINGSANQRNITNITSLQYYSIIT